LLLSFRERLEELERDLSMLVETSNRAHAAIPAAAQLPRSPKTQAFEGVVMYYGYRFYDPEAGRWPSRDPIGERGGVNLYGFVGNDGVNDLDYLGKDAVNNAVPVKEHPLFHMMLEGTKEAWTNTWNDYYKGGDIKNKNGKTVTLTRSEYGGLVYAKCEQAGGDPNKGRWVFRRTKAVSTSLMSFLSGERDTIGSSSFWATVAGAHFTDTGQTAKDGEFNIGVFHSHPGTEGLSGFGDTDPRPNDKTMSAKYNHAVSAGYARWTYERMTIIVSDFRYDFAIPNKNIRVNDLSFGVNLTRNSDNKPVSVAINANPNGDIKNFTPKLCPCDPVKIKAMDYTGKLNAVYETIKE
jgi:RHS repeat-associated protein